jgi:hypothetical protein
MRVPVRVNVRATQNKTRIWFQNGGNCIDYVIIRYQYLHTASSATAPSSARARGLHSAASNSGSENITNASTYTAWPTVQASLYPVSNVLHSHWSRSDYTLQTPPGVKPPGNGVDW